MRSWLVSWLLLGCPLALAACSAAAPSMIVPDSGSLRCVIQREGYAAGALNPADSCQICNPSLAPNAWTSQPDLTDCRASDAGNVGDGGTFCQLGQCVAGCGIGGLVILAGAANPANACQICAPAEALGSWSIDPGNHGCDGGVPDAGSADAGTCIIGSVVLGAGELIPGNACGFCQPSLNASGPTPLPDGTPCDAGGNVCIGAACMPGCYLDGALVAPHRFQSGTQDACCNPDLDVGAWTPGFLPLPTILLTGAQGIAVAAVTGSHAQMLVGDTLGGLDLITELSDGTFAQSSIAAGNSNIAAVAAVDANGDGLVDLLYHDTVQSSVLLQNAGHTFGSPQSWPELAGNGGLWAEESIDGPQILSFDSEFSQLSKTPSELQPQIDASGQLFDTCPAAVAYCTPTGLAFGSFRKVGGVEFVMTCNLGTSTETLYGEYSLSTSVCGGDGGWVVGQFVPGDFGTGAVTGPIVAAGDLNGDGLSEVVGGGNPEVDLLMNWGPSYGTFYSGATRVPLSGGANVTALGIANLRGDAGGTILALDIGNSALDVFYPPPPYDAGVALTASYTISTQSTTFGVGDFNGDGRPDVAVVNVNGVQVFQRQCP